MVWFSVWRKRVVVSSIFFICNEPNGSLLQSNTALWHWPPPPGKEELPGVFTLVAGVLLRSSLEQPEKKEKKKNALKWPLRCLTSVLFLFTAAQYCQLYDGEAICASLLHAPLAPPPPLYLPNLLCIWRRNRHRVRSGVFFGQLGEGQTGACDYYYYY